MELNTGAKLQLRMTHTKFLLVLYENVTELSCETIRGEDLIRGLIN